MNPTEQPSHGKWSTAKIIGLNLVIFVAYYFLANSNYSFLPKGNKVVNLYTVPYAVHLLLLFILSIRTIHKNRASFRAYVISFTILFLIGLGPLFLCAAFVYVVSGGQAFN